MLFFVEWGENLLLTFDFESVTMLSTKRRVIMVEKSYMMVKPEFANNRVVIAVIIQRILDAGLSIEKRGYIQYDRARARKHYHELLERKFYPELEDYITSDKAYGMVVVGENAIAKGREIVGATNGSEVGTLRHDIPSMLGQKPDLTKNVIHASDSLENAKIEIGVFKELKAEFDKEDGLSK